MSILKEFLIDTSELLAIPLLRFEGTNVLWKATSRGRTKLSDAQATLREFETFNLPEHEVATREILRTAHIYNRLAYDAVYLTLAESEQIPLVTADKHLYNPIKNRSRLVLWVGDLRDSP